jgi:hypothetical protein
VKPIRLEITLDAIRQAGICQDSDLGFFYDSPNKKGNSLVYEDFEKEIPRLAKIDNGRILMWMTKSTLIPLTISQATLAINKARTIDSKSDKTPNIPPPHPSSIRNRPTHYGSR